MVYQFVQSILAFTMFSPMKIGVFLALLTISVKNVKQVGFILGELWFMVIWVQYKSVTGSDHCLVIFSDFRSHNCVEDTKFLGGVLVRIFTSGKSC